MKNKKASKQVLIIEDELLLAKDLAMILEDAGYACAGISRDGVKALELFKAQEIDLVLCDINIQGTMDGIELVKALLAEKTVPIIYLTAYSDSETTNRAMETYPSAFLIKPYNERSLQIAIELALKNHEKNAEDDVFHENFTKRENEIIALLASGKTSNEIAEDLFISRMTVEKHRSNILHKSGCKNTADLVRLYYQNSK